jgi:hypothetical protein
VSIFVGMTDTTVGTTFSATSANTVENACIAGGIFTPGDPCAPNCTDPRAGRLSSAAAESGLRLRNNADETATAVTIVKETSGFLGGPDLVEFVLAFTADDTATADFLLLDILPLLQRKCYWLLFICDEYGYAL